MNSVELPEVSVIVPLHNRRTLVPFTLESLRANRHPGVRLQVLVVDDGSTDGGADHVESNYAWATVIRQNRQGGSAARNTGLSHALGSAVLFLDSDDLVEDGFFDARLAALSSNSTAAGAYGPWDAFESDEAFEESSVRLPHTRYPTINQVESKSHLQRLLRGWYIPGPATLWRTQVLKELGGHDIQLVINQDVDLMFRTLTRTGGLVGVAAPRALTRIHGGARQGSVTTPEAVRQVAALRRRFRDELMRLGIFDEDLRKALAEYAFDSWASWRSISPEASDELLTLSRQLWPEMNVRGGRFFRALGTLLGPANATIAKERLRQVISKTTSARVQIT